MSQYTHFQFLASDTINPKAKKEPGKISGLANLLSKNEPDDVVIWKIEYDTENGYVSREIGFNEKGEAIYHAPSKTNYGHWSKDNLKLKQLNRFNPKPISLQEFDKDWTVSDF
jgi:hypothetical protein